MPAVYPAAAASAPYHPPMPYPLMVAPAILGIDLTAFIAPTANCAMPQLIGSAGFSPCTYAMAWCAFPNVLDRSGTTSVLLVLDGATYSNVIAY